MAGIVSEAIRIEDIDYIKIGNEGFVVRADIYKQFGGEKFWTAEKANLTVQQQKEFGPKILNALVEREKLQLNIDKNGAEKALIELLETKSAKEAASSRWQAIVPPLYSKKGAAQLFVPTKNRGMLINAAKSREVNGGVNPDLIVLCVEDASHYNDGIRGVYMMSSYRDGYLESEDGNKKWQEGKDKRVPAIMRYNGFGAAQFPTDEIAILKQDGKLEAIDRIIFESSFDGINAAKNFERLGQYEFGGPVAYYPKTETPREIALIDEILATRDRLTGLKPNTSKVALVLEDTKQMALLDEALYKGKNRIVMVSFGRYDAVDANIGMNREDKNNVPPGPDSMTITNEPAVSQEGHMVKLLAKHGVTIVGGMADMVRSKDPEIEAAAKAKVIEDKKREAEQGASASWCSSPYQVPYVKKGLAAGAAQSNLTKRCNQTYNVSDIVNFPKGKITEEEIDRFVIRKGLEFFEGYLRGIGCVPIKLSKPLWSAMDDFATGGRFQGMFAWITAHHGAIMQKNEGGEEKITFDLYASKIDKAIADIQKGYNDARKRSKGEKASAKNWADTQYDNAGNMFKACIASEICPSTVKDEFAWPAYLRVTGREKQADLHEERINQIRETALKEMNDLKKKPKLVRRDAVRFV